MGDWLHPPVISVILQDCIGEHVVKQNLPLSAHGPKESSAATLRHFAFEAVNWSVGDPFLPSYEALRNNSEFTAGN